MSFEALASARRDIVTRQQAELKNLRADIEMRARILEDLRVREATLVAEITSLDAFPIPVPGKKR